MTTFRPENLKAKENSEISVQVTRGNFTESVHLVDAVVVDSKGKIVETFGAAEKVQTSPRSAIKMLQAVSLIESEAFSKFNLTQKHLALACASHNGEKPHTDLVQSWLMQLGFDDQSLVCGPHMPSDESTAHEMIRQGLNPKRCHNNCSGKHSGILSTILQLNLNAKEYGKYDHPIQIRLRKILGELMEVNVDSLPWGIDGCGIPTYSMPLISVAQGMSHLLLDRPISIDRKAAFELIKKAVIAEPFYIAGTNGFCTDIIQKTDGKAIVKTGAEGFYVVVLPEQGLAMAVKARDGQTRASKVATAWLLKRFGGMSESQFLQLSRHTQPEIRNWAGEIVGKIFVGDHNLQ